MTEIDADLVKALVSDQFPRWADLPVAPVPMHGWDNRTFRLGDELAVRLPSAAGYAEAVEREGMALAVLAGAGLPQPVPEPVAIGRAGRGYPFPWSVRRWLPGQTMTRSVDLNTDLLAGDLGAFLTALRAVPSERGPAAGRQSFFRGCHPSAYSDEVSTALHTLADKVDVERCRQVWLEATTTAWPTRPVWFHGDLDLGNLLIRHGRLSAVIDFGCCGVGDPACDLALAWTYFSGASRTTFRQAVGLDAHSWRRARGWVLWKALVTMANMSGPDSDGIQSRNLTRALGEPIL